MIKIQHLLLKDDAGDRHAALRHLAEVTNAGVTAAGLRDKWVFTLVLDSLAYMFEKQYEAGGLSATARISTSLETIAKAVSEEASARIIRQQALTKDETQQRAVALPTNFPAQLLLHLCGMYNRLAVQLLAKSWPKSATSGLELASHVPILRFLAPALAASARGAAAAGGNSDATTSHLNSEYAAGSLQALQRFWFLTLLLDAAAPPCGTFDGAVSIAMGSLAASTPELAPVSCREEEQARVSAEMRPLLQHLGQQATPSSLQRVLQGLLPTKLSTLKGGEGILAAPALLLAGAAMHAARARTAPLILLSSHGIPFVPLLRHLQALPQGNLEFAGLRHVALGAFSAYVDRLAADLSTPPDSEDDRLAAQAGLACGLLPFLVPGSYESGSQVAGMVEECLQHLLCRLPWLQWHVPFTHALAAEWDTAHHEVSATHPGAASLCPRTVAETMLRQMARQGAAAAPHWTAAVQEAAARLPESSEGILRVAAIVTEVDAGCRISTIADTPAPLFVEAEAADNKASHMGRIRGFMRSAIAEGQPFDSVASQCLAALQHVFNSDCSAAELQDVLLQAAAAVVVLQSGPVVRQLVSALAWAPSCQLAPACVRPCVAAWLWVSVEAPHFLVDVVVQSLDVLRWGAARRQGIFSGEFHFVDCGSSGTGLDDTDDSGKAEAVEIVSSISAQHTCILFLLETWRVCRSAAGPHKMAAAAALQRGLLALVSFWRCVSHHPAAAGAVFRLALLALEATDTPGTRWPQEGVLPLLRNAALNMALSWFSSPPAWHGSWSAADFREQAQSVLDFGAAAQATWGQPASYVPPASWPLLELLLKVEADRLGVWAAPTTATLSASPDLSSATWCSHAAAAWQVDPRLALALRQRFPGKEPLTHALEALVKEHAADPQLQRIPEAATLLATPRAAETNAPELQQLYSWAAAPLLQATALLAGGSGHNGAVRQYALQSLTSACSPEEVAFFLPQLVQQLRHDSGALMETFLLLAASRSALFAHLLLCALKTESKPPAEAFNPTVKRSGWRPPVETGLWDITAALRKRVWEQMPPHVANHLQAELSFFEEVTSVSGKLYEVDKLQRRAKAAELLRDISPSRPDLYLPTDPEARVLSLIPSSATPMQSAAKVPILVAFEVQRQVAQLSGGSTLKKSVESCIFKVGDDCRQDVLALQVMELLKEAFEKAGLELYLSPYGVVPTDYECGIIQVVPDCASRSALGETSDGGLRQIFEREFGATGSLAFERARHNFLRSLAGCQNFLARVHQARGSSMKYAIVCFLLQVKDRHNGNIMIDREGHLVHIDFGFLLEISPGGNLGFESAPFKFSHEMTQLLDPSGSKDSQEYHNFEALCIRGYLAARGVAEGVMAAVELMTESGLPCFGRGAPIANMRRRFNLDFNDRQAAAFMQQRVRHSYDRWTTGVYDVVQYIQNNIPK